MANEDKARAIAEQRKVKYDGFYSSYLDCYLSALDMSKIKDEQAKKAFCRTRCGNDADGCERNCPILQLFHDELNNIDY